ncbi:MAG TPA: NAD(P)H-dependent glycerol-3-phosphate dehydrogenase [Bryobacteraceae bacterium]|nr:NAD(P)H-dependent glycerol-3-phosphate dehydrogenase [Bryobacteraceae bacterium]
MNITERLAIIGGGSWGTALAIVLAPRFRSVTLWIHEPTLCAKVALTRENSSYLPGFQLPGNVQPTTSLPDALHQSGIVLTVVPSQYLRSVLDEMLPHLDPGAICVSATKGLELSSLLRMSQVLTGVIERRFPARVAVLSGPTFAREVAAGDPTAVVVASQDLRIAEQIQTAFSGPTFRLYTNPDVVGVELGAALKNVIAIGAGIAQGLGLGSNAVAALVTRGLVEITRLACTMGGQERTLAGLAGLGDLVLTCTGDLSRNRRVGILLGQGQTLQGILDQMNMVAEGVQTTTAAVDLSRKLGVEMPIVSQMFEVLHNAKPPRDGIRDLMERQLKPE